MKQKFKIIIPAIVVIITAVICVLMIVNNKSKEAIKEITTTTNTTEVKTTIGNTISTASETTTKEETTFKEKTEEIKQQITTTKPSNSSNNSSNKTEVNKTTPKPTTSAETKPVTQPTTESTTDDYYDKNKFSEGYIVTSNPHDTEKAGAYWVSGHAEFYWKEYKEDEEVYDMQGNRLDLDSNGSWHLSWTRTTAMASETQKDKLRNILSNKIEPPRDGKYDGEVYEMVVWAWLPE